MIVFQILYIEDNKLNNLKKAKNPETKDVTSVYEKGKQSTKNVQKIKL